MKWIFLDLKKEQIFRLLLVTFFLSLSIMALGDAKYVPSKEILDLLDRSPYELKQRISIIESKKLYYYIQVQLAQTNGVNNGQNEIRMMHLLWFGIGAKKDLTEADDYAQIAAEKGHPKGLYLYARKLKVEDP